MKHTHHSHAPSRPAMSAADAIAETLGRCRTAGLRRTKALEELLETLYAAPRPMTLTELAASPRLTRQCDKVTVFRLLHRLALHGIVRRLGLHERAAYFTLLLPDRHHDYLICTGCGTITAVDAPCPVHALEDQIARETGYRKLYHELEFFGICPSCAAGDEIEK